MLTSKKRHSCLVGLERGADGHTGKGDTHINWAWQYHCRTFRNIRHIQTKVTTMGKINLNAFFRLVGFLTMTDLFQASYDLRFKVHGRLLKRVDLVKSNGNTESRQKKSRKLTLKVVLGGARVDKVLVSTTMVGTVLEIVVKG